LVWVASAVARSAFEDGVTDMKACELKSLSGEIAKDDICG